MGKHAGGRPRMFETPKKLKDKLNEYFQFCLENKEEVLNKEGEPVKVSKPKIPTIAGCAYFIGMDRQTFYNYENKDEFFGTIKEARDRILGLIEDSLVNGEGNVAGKIFISKNYGYSDRQILEHNIQGEIAQKIQELFF